MKTKRSAEGVILIDHRNSPGLSEEFMRENKLDGPAVPAGHTFESALIVCHSCQRDVVLNPNRTRERAWCRKHDSYLCDFCDARRAASGGECISAEQKIEELFKQISKTGT